MTVCCLELRWSPGDASRDGWQTGLTAVRSGDDAAHSLSAAVIDAQRAGHGGAAVGHVTLQGVRSPGQVEYDAASRDAILRLRHLLEMHRLAEHLLRVVNDLMSRNALLLRRTGTAIDATLIAAPSLSKNAEGKRDS